MAPEVDQAHGSCCSTEAEGHVPWHEQDEEDETGCGGPAVPGTQRRSFEETDGFKGGRGDDAARGRFARCCRSHARAPGRPTAVAVVALPFAGFILGISLALWQKCAPSSLSRSRLALLLLRRVLRTPKHKGQPARAPARPPPPAQRLLPATLGHLGGWRPSVASARRWSRDETGPSSFE